MTKPTKKPTKKPGRYILVGGKPFTMYTGTTTFTDLEIIARTDKVSAVDRLTEKHWENANGLMLWIDTHTGQKLDF